MAELSLFWRNPELHDAILLLSADNTSLQKQTATVTSHDLALLDTNIDCEACRQKAKKRKVTAPSADENSVVFLQPLSHSTESDEETSVVDAAIVDLARVLTIPVHRIVLSTGSAFFRTCISTLVGDGAAAARQSATSSGLPVIAVHEEHVTAAEQVLQYLYTKKVESSFSTAPQLMQLLMVADRWVVPGCVTACCKALAALPCESPSFDEVLAIYAPGGGPIPLSLLGSSEFKPVRESALAKLLKLFGNLPNVVASPTLTAQLLQLPHAAMVELLDSDKLTTDCEDIVLMVLSWWLQGPKGFQCLQNENASELLDLKNTVRYSRLSSTYIAQALPLTSHLSATLVQLSELQEFLACTPSQYGFFSRDVKSACPAGWFKLQRSGVHGSGRDTKIIRVELAISTAQLTKHLTSVKNFQSGDPAPKILSAAADFKGLQISLRFSSNPEVENAAANFRIDVSTGVRLPEYSSSASLEHGVICSFEVSIQSNVPDKPLHSISIETRFVGSERGWANFAQLVSKLPGDPLQLSWWDPFIVDGHVRFKADFKDERVN